VIRRFSRCGGCSSILFSHLAGEVDDPEPQTSYQTKGIIGHEPVMPRLVVGVVADASPIFGGLARLDTNGSLDTTFELRDTLALQHMVARAIAQCPLASKMRLRSPFATDPSR
jgi:hypothetical protein